MNKTNTMIVVNVGGNEYEFSVDEARELYEALRALFGEQYAFPAMPYGVGDVVYYPITCLGG